MYLQSVQKLVSRIAFVFASSPMSLIERVDCNLSEFFSFAMFRVHVFFCSLRHGTFCSLRNGRRAPHKNI